MDVNYRSISHNYHCGRRHPLDSPQHKTQLPVRTTERFIHAGGADGGVKHQPQRYIQTATCRTGSITTYVASYVSPWIVLFACAKGSELLGRENTGYQYDNVLIVSILRTISYQVYSSLSAAYRDWRGVQLGMPPIHILQIAVLRAQSKLYFDSCQQRHRWRVFWSERTLVIQLSYVPIMDAPYSDPACISTSRTTTSRNIRTQRTAVSTHQGAGTEQITGRLAQAGSLIGEWEHCTLS